MKIWLLILSAVFNISAIASAKQVVQCITVGNWGETLTVSNNLDSQSLQGTLIRNSNGNTYEFLYDEVKVQEFKNRSGSFGSSNIDQIVRYNLDLYFRWFGVNLHTKVIDSYTRYILTSGDTLVTFDRITGKNGQVLFSGFNFKGFPGKGFFRVCKL